MTRTTIAVPILGFALSMLCQPVRADTANSTDYSVFNPVPDDSLRPFCTDRPTKGTGPCTIDAGRFQIESDLLNVTAQNANGVTTDTWFYSSPNLKLGLTDDVDAEIALSPLVTIETNNHRLGTRSRVTGFGDIVLRAKTNFVGNAGGEFGVAFDPYIKLPTAESGIGNGAVEVGGVVPMSFTLSDAWSLAFVPEIDVLKNALNDGRHIATDAAFSVTRSLSQTVTVSAELWGEANSDPAAANVQYSFDLATTWQPPLTKDLQFDIGLNLGLNRSTPGTQAYAGISHRF